MATTEFTINKDKLEVEIRRVYNAPIEKVWQAHVDPDLVVKWWGPRELEAKVEKLEPKVGGQWRILHRDRSGTEHWFHGEYQEVASPIKLSGRLSMNQCQTRSWKKLVYSKQRQTDRQRS
jgi:uncharacterized protein YndB with AHSA1/START domain